MLKNKKKNNFIKYIGIFLILSSLFYSFYFIYAKYKDRKTTEMIINTLFTIDNQDKDAPITNNEIKSVTPTINYYLSDDYLGYIELPDYGIKRLISKNADKKTLDKGLVGLLESSAEIDDEKGNIIIAGHSISNVFQKLHNTKIGDKIKIVTKKDTYSYIIKEKHTIENNDMSFFKQTDNEKILTLITCNNNPKYRFIVIAELQNN